MAHKVQGLRTGPYPAVSRLTPLRACTSVPRLRPGFGPVSPERPQAAKAEARLLGAATLPPVGVELCT